MTTLTSVADVGGVILTTFFSAGLKKGRSSSNTQLVYIQPQIVQGYYVLFYGNVRKPK